MFSMLDGWRWATSAGRSSRCSYLRAEAAMTNPSHSQQKRIAAQKGETMKRVKVDLLQRSPGDNIVDCFAKQPGETTSERVARYVVGWLLLPVFVAVGTWNHLREWSEEIWGILCEIAKGRF
jgi:hypothetical protein